MKKGWLAFLIAAVLLTALLSTTVLGASQTAHGDPAIHLSYDDRKNLSQLLGVAAESVSVSDQIVTSCAVGTRTRDENVLVYQNGTLYAVGTGTATLTVNGQDYAVTVSAAPISLFMITGHSVGMGQEGNAAESILCEAGQVYSTYGRGASIDNTAGGLGWGSAVRADGELDAFAAGGGGNIGEGSGIAYEWNRITGEKVWVMNVALGGSCLNEWVPDALNHNPTYGQSSHFNNAVSVFRSAQTVVAAEIAAGHYTLGNMAIIQHTGANFTWYPGWTHEGFQADYEAIWNGYQEQLAMDMDGDGDTETVEALGFVPYWDVIGGENYVLDKAAGYYMSASDEYPGIFTVSQVYRSWLTDEDVQKNFPEIDYTTQSGVELVKPTSTLHTNKGGSSDNSVYCSKDYAHLSQVAYNAVGQDIAKNLYQYFRQDRQVKALTFREPVSAAAVTRMQMGMGESVRLTCTNEPFYGEGVTFTVTGNLELSYPLCVTATGLGSGALYAYQGDTLLAQVDIEIISTHSHCVCAGLLEEHDCQRENWVPWGDTEGEKATLPTESGNYYLVSDITLTTTASLENQNVKLCLNGHKVESAVKTFWVGSNSYTGGSLTLTDCKDSGTVTVTAVDSNGGGLLRMRANGESLNIYGGTYDATGLTTVSAHGGLLYLTGGITNIYGGTFRGGLLKDAGKHGSIGYVTQNARVNIYGGTFLGGNCSKGGIFEMDSANVTVSISGGSFTGGNATYGDIFNVANKATLNISGGSYSHKAGNPDTLRSFSGGVICLTGGTFDGLRLVNGANSAYTDILGILGKDAYYMADGTAVTPEAGTLSLSGSVTVVAGHVDHCVCTDGAEHSCQITEWQPWSSETSLPGTAGNYYLTTDVTLRGAWDWNNKSIQLCLNGHRITGAGGTAQTVMLGVVNNTDSSKVTRLAVCDCKGGGVIQSDARVPGPVLRIRKDPYVQVDFYSGILKGTAADTDKNGGVVAVYGGQFHMYGGKIYGADGDSTAANVGGGAVYVSDVGIFSLHGGTIYGGNDWFRGGAVSVDAETAEFYMYGGTVVGGKATHGNAMATAGNVYIYGGIIDCDITAGSALQIRGNGAYRITQCSFPGGIKTQNCTLMQVLTENSLFADEEGLMHPLTETQNTIQGAVRVQLHGHCICGAGYADGIGNHQCAGTKDWTPWTGRQTLPTQSGCYYLTGDVTLSGVWDWKNADITLCLNGHRITGAGGTAQTVILGGKDGTPTNTRLVITDCRGSGEIVSSANQNGAVLRTRDDAGVQVEIYGGSLIATNTAASASGGAVAVYGGSVQMYGGTLDGFVTSGNGGTVLVANANALFALHGGTVTGGSAYSGGNLCVSNHGTFTMDGGSVCDGIASYLGGNMLVSGTVNLMGGTVTGGTAGHGGAIRIETAGTVKLDGATLRDNRADYRGGSLSVVGTFYMTAGTVENSTASSGGVLYNNGGTVTVTGGSIRNGTAEKGGLIYNHEGTVALEGGFLEGGTATKGNGGGICNLAELTVGAVTLSGDTVDNTAQAGGVLYSEGSLILDGATLTGGKASVGIGGTVAIGGGTARISNSTVSGGVGGCGSALCLKDGTLTVENTKMDRGTFAVCGGQLILAGREQTHVTLAADLTGMQVTGKALVDLKGFHVTDAVVSGNLQLADSETDDYQGGFGSFTGTVTGTVEQLSKDDGKTYLTVCADGTYSAHRYYVAITYMSLRPAQAAFGYKATFCGDETVRSLVTGYGYQLWLDGHSQKTYTRDGSFDSGDVLALRLRDMLMPDNDQRNALGSTATICGNAVAMLNVNGQTLILKGKEQRTTLQQMVEAVNANASAYNERQIEAMQTLCNTYAAWMQGWKTENILNWNGQQESEDLLQVGFGRTDITPTASVPLAGYGNTSARMSGNVLSSLYSTCIAFTDEEGQTVLLFHNDLISTNSDLYPVMCRAISEATGVPVGNIYVSATHTHSGPDLSNTAEPAILTYRQYLVEQMAQAAVQAMADRQTARMYMGATNCPNLNFIRHYLLSDGSYVGSNFGDATGKTVVDYACQVDDQMQLLRFTREGGKDVVLMNWQMHPTRTGGAEKYDISSDVVGVIRDEVEAGADCLFAYFTGASGDVNASSRIREDNIISEFTDYQTHGQLLAEYALNTLENSMQSVESGNLKTYSIQYTGKVDHSEDDLVEIAQVYYDHWTTAHEWDTVAGEALAYGINSGYHAGSILSHSKLPETWDVGLKGFCIGDVAFIMAPYEMFSTNGQNIKNDSPFAMTFVVTCANGNEGYMPTWEAFAYDCYESNVCKFESGIAEALEEACLDLLQRLYRG